MSRRGSELRAQRKLTKFFIDDNPTRITLTPNGKVRTGTGGYAWVAGEPREPQVMRVIDLSSPRAAQKPNGTVTIDGTDYQVQFMLLGEWDCAMSVNDFWQDGDKTWRIGEILPDNEYERRALVIKHG